MENLEIWKDVVGYEGFYMVSNIGKVKSLSREIKTRGEGVYISKERILKPYSGGGYSKVALCKNGIPILKDVHIIVAMSFLGHVPCGYKLVVNHKDFNSVNNRVENLEIITQRENANRKHLKSSSPFTGVSFDKIKNNWKSTILINKTSQHLGFYKTENEAHQSYIKALNEFNNGTYKEKEKRTLSSNYKGVCWYQNTSKWMSRITINGKRELLGYFNTETEAYNAYQNKLKN